MNLPYRDLCPGYSKRKNLERLPSRSKCVLRVPVFHFFLSYPQKYPDALALPSIPFLYLHDQKWHQGRYQNRGHMVTSVH